MTIDVIEKSRKRFNILYQANHTIYKTKDHTKRGLMEFELKTGRTNNFFRNVPLHGDTSRDCARANMALMD